MDFRNVAHVRFAPENDFGLLERAAGDMVIASPAALGRSGGLGLHERFASEVDKHLDRGYRACPLRESGNALIVADVLRHFDGDRYELSGFVVMPNHVHVLFAPGSD
jgi:hypothetical protein